MIQGELFSGVRDVSESLAAAVPTIAAAAILILAGWLLGRLLAWLARRATSSALTRLGRRPSLEGAIETSGASTQVPAVIGGFVFWVVVIFFVAAAMETLGLPVVTSSLSRVASYLPNVLAALVIVFAGLIAARVAGATVTRAASRTGMALAPAIGTTVRGAVILVAMVVAVEQVGIQADILVIILATVVGTTLAGAGLAFGLGARTAVSNIIASHYVARAYRVGQTIRVGDVEGKIVETTPTAVFLSSRQGRVMIPARHFSEEVSVLVTESEP